MSQANLIVAFVVDTSESMSTRTSDGRSLMDHAKDVVEQMTVKNRHTPAHHVLLTNCLLLTTEDWPVNVKTSWSDWGDKPEKRMARFQEQLKKLEPCGKNAIAPALGKAFELLGQHRLRTGVDCWGKGRSPWCTEPGAVVLISDGKNATAACSAGDSNELRPLDMNTVATWASGAVGADLCGRPFRWDQRLFALVLGVGEGRGGGEDDVVEVTVGDENGRGGLGWDALETQATLKSMCEETGGCLVTWDGEDTSKHKTLANHVNDMMGYVHKRAPVVMFRSENSLHGGAADGDDMDDLDGFDGFNSPQAMNAKKPPAARAGVVLRGGSGVWPIPEPFWVDRMLDSLPPRPEAQPEIWFRKPEPGITDGASPAEMLEQLGVGTDIYELEWCGEGSRLDVPRLVTWQLLVKESGPLPGAGKSFGYLRASQSSGKTVMVLLPYNYEELIPLLRLRASTVQATKSPQPPAIGSPWARDFIAYLKGVPTYYLPALQRILQPFGVISLIPGENLQAGVGVHHRKVVEKLNNLKDLAGRHVERADRIERAGRAQDPEHRQQQQQEGGGGLTGGLGPCSLKPSYANAFQVPVGELLSQWEKMRAQLFGSGGATVKGLFSGAPGPRFRSLASAAQTPRFSGKSIAADDDEKGGGSRWGRGTAKVSLAGRAGLRSPVLGCVAESLAPARSTQEMSDFMSRMLGVEFPRDPRSDPGPDENMSQGGFQRLMATTTFESPFAKKKLGLSPVGLYEAANESAILDIELGDDGEKKSGDHKAAGESDSSDSASSEADKRKSVPHEEAASCSDSPVAMPCTTPARPPASPNQSQGPNGELKRSSSISRRQLPKVVAVRGRRRFRPDVNISPVNARAGEGISVTGKSYIPPVISSSSRSGSNSGSGSADEKGRLLYPPASPALPVPRTPDHSPPPSPSPYAGDDRDTADFFGSSSVSSSSPSRRERSLDFGRPVDVAAVDDGGSNHDKNDIRGKSNGGAAGEREITSVAVAVASAPLPSTTPTPRQPPPRPRQAKPRPPAAPRPPPPKPLLGKRPAVTASAIHASTTSAAGQLPAALKPRPAPPRPPPHAKPSARPPTAASNMGTTMFAPSSSPATFTRTTSPALFTPTVSPATRSPGAFLPTSSPASRGPPTADGQPRFTPTASPVNFASRSSDGGIENDKRGQQPAGFSTEKRGNGEGEREKDDGTWSAVAKGTVDDGRSRKRGREDSQDQKAQAQAQESPRGLSPHDYILPDGWILAFSKREKRDYFFNQRDNITQWHPPKGSRPK